MVSRRSVVQGLGLGVGFATLAPGFAAAMADTDRRFVFVFLRGGVDGLSAVQAYGEPRFRELRQELADGRPSEGTPFDALKLDGLFALNPDLPRMHAMYQAGELAVIHATCHGYRDRSHFDAQDAFDRGTVDKAVRTGWLNRTLGVLPRSGGDLALAIGATPPLSLRGSVPVGSWAPSQDAGMDSDTLYRLASLYRPDRELGPSFDKGFEAEAVGRSASLGKADVIQNASGRAFIQQASAAGTFLRRPDGPRIVTLDYGNWDSHSGQNLRYAPGQQSSGGFLGRYAEYYIALDHGLQALKEGLGPDWSKTVVMVVTEFGRTVRINGNKGTDHGTGGAAFLLGGGVKGGRVLADWPGLRDDQMLDGRDLRPTTDLRAVCKGLLRDHMGVGESALGAIFPDSQSVKPFEGLLRA